MTFETESQKRTISRWSKLAIQLNGAADSRNYDYITTAAMIRELESGDVFDFLARELPAEVWTISKLTDVDRHKLSQHWKTMAKGYQPKQFHVERNGLALLWPTCSISSTSRTTRHQSDQRGIGPQMAHDVLTDLHVSL